MENTQIPRAIYEQPLNERIRILLRLESLFQQAHQSVDNDTERHSRFTIGTLLEILGVLSSLGDLRSEVIKELDRLSMMMGRYQGKPSIDEERLRGWLRECRHLIDEMKSARGLLGSEL